MKFLGTIIIASVLLIMSSFAIDKVFPKVDIKDLKGNTVKTEKFLDNKKVTVVSFFATWCKPCQLEMDNISKVYGDWEEKYGVEMVAISIDNSRSVSRLKTLVESKNWPYEILLDETRKIQSDLGFQAIPQTFLIDKEGNIVYDPVSYTHLTLPTILLV